MAKNIYTKEYEIRYYEADYKERLLSTSLMNYFTDIAMEHSRECGVGLNYLKERGLAWVIYKYDIEILGEAYILDKLKVTTEAYGFNKFIAYRSFRVVNQKDELIAKGNSIFLLINSKRRRPVRIDGDFYEAYGIPQEEIRELKFTNIHKLREPQEERAFQVRYTDIDTNGHVNNVKYIDWLIEAIPVDIIKELKIAGIKIDYLKECFYGDTITSQAEVSKEPLEKGIKIIHRILNHEGKEITTAETYWE